MTDLVEFGLLVAAFIGVAATTKMLLHRWRREVVIEDVHEEVSPPQGAGPYRTAPPMPPPQPVPESPIEAPLTDVVTTQLPQLVTTTFVEPPRVENRNGVQTTVVVKRVVTHLAGEDVSTFGTIGGIFGDGDPYSTYDGLTGGAVDLDEDVDVPRRRRAGGQQQSG